MKHNQLKLFPSKTISAYQKGQCIDYHGYEAEVLDVQPIFTIIIKEENKVICGNALLNEITMRSIE